MRPTALVRGSFRLRTNVRLSMGLAFLLVAGVALVGVFSARSLSARLREVTRAHLPAQAKLAALDEWLTAIEGAAAVLVNEEAKGQVRVDSLARIEEASEALDGAAREYDELELDEVSERLWSAAAEDLRGLSGKARAAAEDLERLRGRRTKGEAGAVAESQSSPWAVFTTLRSDIGLAREALATIREHTARGVGLEITEALSSAARAAGLTLVALVGGLAALGLLWWRLVARVNTTVRKLLAETTTLRDAVRDGALTTRGSSSGIDADFRSIVDGMNETMDAFTAPIAATADYVEKISRGEVPPPITAEYRGDFNRIKDALNRNIEAVSGLIEEMGRMSSAHEAGEIDAAVDASRFQGAWRSMAEGVNAMVGAHVAMTRRAMVVFSALGRGDFAADLEPLPGKKKVVNDAVAQVRGNLRALVADMTKVSTAMEQGSAAVIIELDSFEGDWRPLAEGVAETAASYAATRKAMVAFAELGRGHFDVPMEAMDGKRRFISDTVESVRNNLKALVADADALASGAVQGRLSTRADTSRHTGDFRKIADGFNRTLDALLAPVNDATDVLERLAARDLRARVHGAYQGEHARLKRALNETAEALHDALTQVSVAARSVSTAASQIASSSQAVASGASEQASSMEEISSSSQSVAEVSRGAEESAQHATALSRSVQGAATDGAASMEQMKSAMGRIRASAEATSQIIRDVSDIAFQTNLLALNAAVEAARAGDAGRGFAVVAEEVRSLAMRAKEAASRTEELIRQSVKEVIDGEARSRHVEAKLSEIVAGVVKVSTIVGDISLAAQEQTACMTGMVSTVSQMNRVIEQNAASAEESSSAASELAGQAEELAAMVGSFQLDGASTVPGPIADLKSRSLPRRRRPGTVAS